MTIAAKSLQSTEAEKVSVYNDFALTPDPHFTGNFQKLFLPGGLEAVVWQIPEGHTPASIELEFSALGAAMDMKVLAAMEL